MAMAMAIHCYHAPKPARQACNPVDDATHISSSATHLLLPLLPSRRRRRAPAPPPTHNWIRTLRSEAKESGLAEQMKEMAAAEKRWKYQVRDGKVSAISPKQAGYACQLAEHCLLDVRPSTERQKAWVKNSIWIPVFDVDNGFGAETLLKRFSNFSMGGWWSGVPLMKYNSQFIPAVMEKVSLDSNVIVVCQKGLRSLAACEQLYKAGYRNLFWVEGGLDAAEEGDLNREGPQPFKFAGIGGVSEFLGWTDEQRAAGAKEGWTYRAVFFGRLVAVVLAVDALFLGAQQLGQSLHTIK